MASKSSSTKVPSNNAATKPTMSPALTRSRSRKVQPALKERAEAFLANAAADTFPNNAPDGLSRKRKRGAHKIYPKQSQVPETMSWKATHKPSKASRARLEAGEGPLETSQNLTQAASQEDDEDTEPLLSQTLAKKALKAEAAADAKEPQEKRLKVFRKKAPQTFHEKLSRATSQRMIVVSRTRTDVGGYPQEDIEVVGSTGNIYTVTIGLIPTCSCPDSLKGNECKHKVYALHTVLKAPERLQYQRALLTSELHEIFANAPALPTDNKSSDEKDGKRKPADGECPICYMDFDEEHNELVYCKAACGNNMHKNCFEQWANSQAGQTVRCVYCRTPWQTHAGDVKELIKVGSVGEDGYINAAEQLGMTGQRDYSTYHPYWVDRHLGRRRRWY